MYRVSFCLQTKESKQRSEIIWTLRNLGKRAGQGQGLEETGVPQGHPPHAMPGTAITHSLVLIHSRVGVEQAFCHWLALAGLLGQPGQDTTFCFLTGTAVSLVAAARVECRLARA